MSKRLNLNAQVSAEITERYAAATETSFSTPMLMTGFPPAKENRVTYANWMTPPFNRWGMHHVRQLTATTPVRNSGAVSALPQAAANIASLNFESVTGQTVSVLHHLYAANTDGFIVMQHGKVLYENYFNGMKASDCHIMFSVTKSLVGIVAENLIAQGQLQESARVDSILPELSGSAFGDASVRQVLDMAVGIDYVEDYNDPASTVCQFFYAGNYKQAPQAFPHIGDLYEFLPTLKKHGEHGNLFHYVTAVTEVLGWMTERVSGVAIADAMSQLWTATGAQQDGFFITDPAGRSGCGAGFNATLRDMARYGNFILNKGVVDGQPVLEPGVVDRIIKGSDPALFAADDYFNSWLPGASYRSQWYVMDEGQPAIMGCGIHGQYLYVDFNSGVVMVKQASLPVAEPAIDTDTPVMLRAIARQLAR